MGLNIKEIILSGENDSQTAGWTSYKLDQTQNWLLEEKKKASTVTIYSFFLTVGYISWKNPSAVFKCFLHFPFRALYVLQLDEFRHSYHVFLLVSECRRSNLLIWFICDPWKRVRWCMYSKMVFILWGRQAGYCCFGLVFSCH